MWIAAPLDILNLLYFRFFVFRLCLFLFPNNPAVLKLPSWFWVYCHIRFRTLVHSETLALNSDPKVLLFVEFLGGAWNYDVVPLV